MTFTLFGLLLGLARYLLDFSFAALTPVLAVSTAAVCCCIVSRASAAARLASKVLLRVCLRLGHSGIVGPVFGCGSSGVACVGTGDADSSPLLLKILLS